MDALDKFSKSKNLCNILGKEIKLWRLVGKLTATKHGDGDGDVQREEHRTQRRPKAHTHTHKKEDKNCEHYY